MGGRDSLVVQDGSWLVSDSAVVRMDLALRAARDSLGARTADLRDREAQLAIQAELVDTLRYNLAGERAYRDLAEQIMAAKPHPLLELAENVGLVGSGMLMCRLTEPRR
jgi:hypothetical protein